MALYCEKHCCWYYEAKCPKCVNNEPPYLRHRSEVANPEDWKLLKRRGWTIK